MDALSLVADEVALEGLDGITIPTLWIRLEDRQPKFPLKLDDPTKEHLWRSLVSNTDVNFYQLPKEREDVELFDRYQDIDPETGIDKTRQSSEPRKDIYPISIVLNKDGIQGSCTLFKERTDVTKHVRSKSLTPLLTLQEAWERFGRKLTLVASQSLRFRTLIGAGSDPDLKLTDESYCLLERVGRARWQGELQKDLHGCSFKIDARKIHYLRKSLVRHGLISMQPYVTRLKSGQQQHSILLLLKRFHVNRRSKYDILMEYVSNVLQQSPGHFITLMALRRQLNVKDRIFKRIFQYMRSAKLVEYCMYPLEDLDPGAGPCTNKRGKKVLVRCLKLLKPYTSKDDADDDDDNDEEGTGTRRRGIPAEGRFMENDILSQAYQNVLSSGTKGIAQTGIGFKMNIGKLESRMICRGLERSGVIKGFMVDEGRQRTTKFISHKSAGVSDQLKLFAKEQERNKRLISSSPRATDGAPATPKTQSTSKSRAKEGAKTPSGRTSLKAGEGGKDDAEKAKLKSGDGNADTTEGVLDGNGGQGSKKAGDKGKTAGRESGVKDNETQPEIPSIQSSTAECETPTCSELKTSVPPDSESNPIEEQTQAEGEEEESSPRPASPLPPSETLKAADKQNENNIVVVKDLHQHWMPKHNKSSKQSLEKSHETYRLLKRKNLIVEAIRNFKIIEGTFPLQKMINDEEKEDGFSSKCCKKTIIRLVHRLSREGLLKIYKTTVIQDGITKNIDMFVHPSVEPNDEIVSRVIEQVRFKISSSYTAVRLQQAEERAKQQEKDKKKALLENFKPTSVRGLGRSFGFQPKMHRLRVTHSFLWYLIYGHPLRQDGPDSTSTNQTSSNAETPSVDEQTADSSVAKLDGTSSGDEYTEQDKAAPGPSQCKLKVFMEDESWRRFVPPVRLHKEYDSGWVMVGDMLLCLPLSIFIQVIQINYKVDGLEDYLNDPVKQHYLVRALPAKMKQQLLYRRKYLFSFHMNLQRLVYMGLLQFGPLEKFKDKDQVFIYLKRKTTIVDTTSTEPHYWLVSESPEKPFERRRYTFKTAEDVENYWFDLMCVCLNTPLGIIRSKRNVSEDDTAPSFVHDRSVFVGLAYLLKGSREVCDDGSVPGDGKGAGGLDSEFFGHLKRNWLWTSHLLSVRSAPTGMEAQENKIRLKSLLSRDALRIALRAGGTTTPRYVTTKRSQIPGSVEVGIEPASRNLEVVGGKNKKRKRSKKEVVKVPHKKRKEPKKRTPAHDEADHRALKMMTRQRVMWSIQEDSLMMLCSVASNLLNSKLKRPFIPHCVVRDLLHAEYEISADKTSVAVGRRSRYILKNPQTQLNYRICLAEVYEDKPLMKLLEGKKPADPESPEDCSAAFSEYVRLLREKFSAVLSTRDFVIPDTKHQLFSRFEVSAIESRNQLATKDALTCIDDIHALVLYNLIQSTLAMNNIQMKSSRSFQTFHMYSRYNQELLCQVFIQCRKRGLVNRRRVHQPFGPKKNRALPILPMSYQLSQSYYRCFAWRFPYSLCTDSFRFLRSLVNKGKRDDKWMTSFYHETENRSMQGEVTEQKEVSKRKKKTSEGQKISTAVGETEVQSEKANCDSKKEEENGERNEEKSNEVNNEKTETTSKGDEEKEQPPSSTPSPGEDPCSRKQTDDHPPEVTPPNTSPSAATEELTDVSDMLHFPLDSPGGSCVASLSLMSLGLLNVHLSIPKQMVVVDSTMVDNDAVKSMAALAEEDDDEDDGEDCEGRKKMEVKAHQASHTNYLLMRGYCSPGIVKLRNLNTTDNIVLESCNVRLQLRNTPSHNLFSHEISESMPLDLMKSGPSLVPSNLTKLTHCSFSSSPSDASEVESRLIDHRGYTRQDIDACAQIRQSLDEAGENGVDVHDFNHSHTHLKEPQGGRSRSLQQYMKDLQEEGQLIKVGGLGARWVLMQHAAPWLLTVNSKHSPASDRFSFMQKQHNFPFMRKRCRRVTRREKEEPPAKKPAVESREEGDGVDVEGAANGAAREKVNEKEVEDEGAREKVDQEEQPEELKAVQDEGTREKVDQEEQPEEQKEEEGEGTREKEDQEEQQEEQKEEEGEGTTEKEVNIDEEGEKQPDQDKEEEAGQEKEGMDESQHKRREPRKRKSSTNIEKEETGAAADDSENVSFISRPWRMVDGNLNRPVCKGMLEGLLYNIMYWPGLPQKALLEHYKDVLQPMAVLDLLEALITLGCVTKKTLPKNPKPTLFSRPVSQKETEPQVETEDPETVFYEPTISCCLRLAQVLPTERHWNYSTP